MAAGGGTNVFHFTPYLTNDGLTCVSVGITSGSYSIYFSASIDWVIIKMVSIESRPLRFNLLI